MINTVKIGPLEYSVIEVEDLHITNGEEQKVRLMGNIDYDKCVISLLPNLASAHGAVTLIHEVIHAITLQSRQDISEDLIDVLSHGLVDVLRRNPDLVEYLTDGDKRG
jgi:hypothetical protein